MQKRGPLFSTTSWLRSERLGQLEPPRRDGWPAGSRCVVTSAKHKKSSRIGVRLELNIAFGVVVKLNRLAN